MANARDRFKVNDRVESTVHAARRNLWQGEKRFGVVRGFGVPPESVRVQVDGIKTVARFHESFWRKIAEG